jgi:SulP family sulfate permease
MNDIDRPRPPFAPNLVAAALCAVLAVAYAGSFGGLIFNGPLEPFAARAVLAGLVSSVVVLPMLAWRSSFYFSFGGPDSNPTAILAVALAAIVADVMKGGAAAPSELAPTALMAVFLSAIGCGAVLYAIGDRRWGRYVRYIPNPVAGGFLAGSGWLLAAGSWKMLTGVPFTLLSLGDASRAHPLALISALGVAAALLVLTRLYRHYLLIPAVLGGGMLAFHAGRAALGLDLAAARRMGLLLAAPRVGDWTHVLNFPYGLVRWDVLLQRAGDLAALTTVAVITILLNVTSLELATGVEGDADRELKTLGMANVLIGLAGGMVALNSFKRSVIGLEAGANSRRAALCCAAMILAVALFAPGLIGLMPMPVLAGFVLYLGVNFLVMWGWDARREMPRADYLVVLAIVAAIAAFGMAAGVGLGLVAACVSFVFEFSRSPSVRGEFSLRDRRSNVDRSSRQSEILRERGGVLRGFSLQGYLFFGTTAKVLERVRAALAETRAVLLDFRLVHGVDGSSTVALKKLKTACAESGIDLVFTGMSAGVEAVVRRCGVALDDGALRTFPDIDRGLEWCEEKIIADASSGPGADAPFAGWFDADDLRALGERFESVRVAPGGLLLRQGDASDSMLIIERGRVSVYLRADAGARVLRLRTYAQGTVVGEMGFYTGSARTADIVADEETVALKLDAEGVARLEREAPALAAKVSRFVACSLALRLSVANAEIRALA